MSSVGTTLTVAEEPGASVTPLTQGELLTYQGAIGTNSTLQDGHTDSVHIINQSYLNAIQPRRTPFACRHWGRDGDG